MISTLGGALSIAPPLMAALFSDVGGFLVGPEFLTVLANLVSSFLTAMITGLLGGLFGFGM